MKRYIKTIDGNSTIRPLNRIVVNKNGMNIYNPPEELLLEDGWTEYIEPIPEPTEEELREQALKDMRNNIKWYDASHFVNEFYYQDVPMWLDKATRVGLKLRFESELEIGETITSLWYDEVKYELPIESAIQMLHDIEIYASKCYDRTQEHYANVSKLTTKEEIESYNYIYGYPEKLRF